MDDVVNDFLVESHENLERLDRAFLTLERDPSATAQIADIFRAIHSIKGTSGFLGLTKLERLSHSGESLLARLRDGEICFGTSVSQSLFELVDAVRAILASIECSGGEGQESYEGLIRELEALCADADAPAPRQPESPLPAGTADALASASGPASAIGPEDAAAAVSTGSIRVDVEHLDRLMNLAGELVLARNQVHLHAQRSEHTGLRASAQRLALITGELQDGVMRARMQPIGNAWTKVPRLVRDLCAQLGKRARVEMAGARTALDRSILEALRDPLTHMVRNSLDHGIETPEQRIRLGKPAEGTLSLRAWTEAGQVRLSIEDDGAGIDPVKLREKALERGILQAEEALRLGETESLGLIFRPGFSMAKSVSTLSGRGVGMDVVKTNLERLGGSVNVSSRVGSGTRIELRIPLTLAILSVLLIECDGQRFALPLSSVSELARIPPAGAPGAIEFVQGAGVTRLRGELLPLVSLRAILGLAPATPEQVQHAAVLEVEGRRFGLLVDSPRDIEEIVLKPPGATVERLGIYSGATILGDGRVALILDLPTLARRGFVARAPEPSRARAAARAAGDPAVPVLVLEVAGFGRIALDLDRVERLEEVCREQVELSGGAVVLHWRGEIVPLLSLEPGSAPGSASCATALPPQARLLVVFCKVSGRRLGLIVQATIDVVDWTSPQRPVAGQPWIRARASLLGRATDWLDLDAFSRRAFDGPEGPLTHA